jgi:cytochrome c-type biogenesis protein CcmE
MSSSERDKDLEPLEAELPPAQTAEGKRTWVLPLVLVVVAGGIAALVLTSFKNATVYSKGIDQVLSEKQKWVGKKVRVEGLLVQGTLKFQEKPCEYQFDATRAGQTMHVRYKSCIKPDTLRDDMPEVGVTAEGTLQQNGDFEASNVLAKCPSKYEMKDKPKGPANGNAGSPAVMN